MERRNIIRIIHVTKKNVAEATINHPPVITIVIGALFYHSPPWVVHCCSTPTPEVVPFSVIVGWFMDWGKSTPEPEGEFQNVQGEVDETAMAMAL